MKIPSLLPLGLSLTLLTAACGGTPAPETPETPTTDDATAAADDAMDAPADDSDSAAETKDIVDTAVAAGGFETLVAAVKAADLVDTLKGDGPFTLFAPTDEAFAALPDGTVDDLLKPENKAKLAGILTYHVVPKKVMAADVSPMDAPTANGAALPIKVEDGKVMIGSEMAAVVKTDIECSNGVIHVIDKVVMPPAE